MYIKHGNAPRAVMKPLRECDFKIDDRWFFYIEEMVQWNSRTGYLFDIRFSNNTLEYYEDFEWKGYSLNEEVTLAYQEFVTNKLEQELWS